MISHITSAAVRTFSDTGQVLAKVCWVSTKGELGSTEGRPSNLHMKALLDRAKHEGINVTKEEW